MYKDREFSLAEMIELEDSAFEIYYSSKTDNALVSTASEYGKGKTIEFFLTKIYKGALVPLKTALELLLSWVQGKKESEFAEHWNFIRDQKKYMVNHNYTHIRLRGYFNTDSMKGPDGETYTVYSTQGIPSTIGFCKSDGTWIYGQ